MRWCVDCCQCWQKLDELRALAYWSFNLQKRLKGNVVVVVWLFGSLLGFGNDADSGDVSVFLGILPFLYQLSGVAMLLTCCSFYAWGLSSLAC